MVSPSWIWHPLWLPRCPLALSTNRQWPKHYMINFGYKILEVGSQLRH
uniref:Uncharacterized protein n=1 Tax=Arundo donax TaxID=35708 RepID=A0A0A8ZT31_ARUDO